MLYFFFVGLAMMIHLIIIILEFHNYYVYIMSMMIIITMSFDQYFDDMLHDDLSIAF
jgi:hypothetical protein